MTTALYILAGLAIGALVGWLSARQSASSRIAALSAREEELRAQLQKREAEASELKAKLSSESEARAALSARYDEAGKNLADQRAALEKMKTELSATFNSLSSEALKSSNEQFLRLASERIGNVMTEAKGTIAKQQDQMAGLLNPIGEALKTYEEHIRQLELRRKQDVTSLDEQIKNIVDTHRELKKETGRLVTALSKPHIRGRWGEIQLRNVVEMAGMVEHCDFEEQVNINTDEGRRRPDMVIRMPGDRSIAVDCKVSAQALLDSVESGTEDERQGHLKRHAAHVREQIKRLVSKDYSSHIDKSTGLTVLFMDEYALYAAFEVDPSMFQDSLEKRVLLAGPVTLFALLKSVAYGWRQEKLAENAEQIAAIGQELYKRVSVWAGHISKIGNALGKATEAYNDSVGSFEKMVLPQTRKFKELGAATGEEIPSPEPIDQSPRNLSLLE